MWLLACGNSPSSQQRSTYRPIESAIWRQELFEEMDLDKPDNQGKKGMTTKNGTVNWSRTVRNLVLLFGGAQKVLLKREACECQFAACTLKSYHAGAVVAAASVCCFTRQSTVRSF